MPRRGHRTARPHYGGIRTRNKGLMNSHRIDRQMEAEYLAQHPEIKPIAEDILELGFNCPDYDRAKPYTLENFNHHVKRCQRCLQILAGRGRPYPQ